MGIGDFGEEESNSVAYLVLVLGCLPQVRLRVDTMGAAALEWSHGYYH